MVIYEILELLLQNRVRIKACCKGLTLFFFHTLPLERGNILFEKEIKGDHLKNFLYLASKRHIRLQFYHFHFELLFQVLAERHERKSVIITSNMGFGDWTQIFGEPNLTAALLGRVTHKAHIINCTWESYRLKDTLTKRNKK